MDKYIIADLDAAMAAVKEGTVTQEQFNEALPEYLEWMKKKEKEVKKSIPAEPAGISRQEAMEFQEKKVEKVKEIPWADYAEGILEKQDFVTALPDETLYFYQDGIYKTGAKPIIKKIAKDNNFEVSRHGIGEIAHHIKIETQLDRNEFNAHENLVWLENGIFNLETGELQDFDPELVSTVQLPITFDKEASCPRFKQFLEEVLSTEEDVLGIQELFGYCLLKNYKYRHFWMLYGAGFNGKSTLLNVLETILGGRENVSNVDLHTLIKSDFAQARLYGKLANIHADISSVKIKTADKIKTLSGNDYLHAEFKGQDGFDFRNYAKIIFSANHIPETQDLSDAFFDRVILINFPNSFKDKPNENLENELLEELPGIFTWAYAGLRRLQEQNKFSNTASREDTRNLWLNESSAEVDFINKYCETVANKIVAKDDLFVKYVEYCQTVKKPALSKNIFCQKVQKNFAVKSTKFGEKGNRRYGFIGLKWGDESLGRLGFSKTLRKERDKDTHIMPKDFKNTWTTQTKKEIVGQQPEEKNE